MLFKTLFLLLMIVNSLQAQVISFGMRKIAYSSNQFGLDLLRASDKGEPRFAFCPFCISSSLVMLMMGTGQSPMSASLRHALYLYGMSDSEINFAYHDMMNHLGVNLPSSKSNVNGRHFHLAHNVPSISSSSFLSSSPALNSPANINQFGSSSSLVSPASLTNTPWNGQSLNNIFHDHHHHQHHHHSHLHHPYNGMTSADGVSVHSHSPDRPAAYTQLSYPISYYGYEKSRLGAGQQSMVSTAPEYGERLDQLPSAASFTTSNLLNQQVDPISGPMMTNSFPTDNSFQSSSYSSNLSPAGSVRQTSTSLYVYDNPLAPMASQSQYPSKDVHGRVYSGFRNFYSDLQPSSASQIANPLEFNRLAKLDESLDKSRPVRSFVEYPRQETISNDQLMSRSAFDFKQPSTYGQWPSVAGYESGVMMNPLATTYDLNNVQSSHASGLSQQNASFPPVSPVARAFGSGFFTRRTPVQNQQQNVATNHNRPTLFQPAYSGLFVNRRNPPNAAASMDQSQPIRLPSNRPSFQPQKVHHRPDLNVVKTPSNNNAPMVQLNAEGQQVKYGTSHSGVAATVNNFQTRPPNNSATGQPMNSFNSHSNAPTNGMTATASLASHHLSPAIPLAIPPSADKNILTNYGAGGVSTGGPSNNANSWSSEMITNEEGASDICFLSNMYVQRDFVINYHYHLLLQKFYKTPIHPLDFVHNGEETRQHINAIVQMQTDNKIHNILDSRPSPATQLLLISALYFNGQLDLAPISNHHTARTASTSASPSVAAAAKSFSNSASSSDDFLSSNFAQSSTTSETIASSQDPVRPLSNDPSTTLSDHSSMNDVSESGRSSAISTDTSADDSDWSWMQSAHTRLRHSFNRYLNCTTIEMPLKGALISFVVMMPSEATGLDTLLTKLNAQMLNDVINSLEIRRMSIKMPRMSFESRHRNLSIALSNLGLADLFKPGYSQLHEISDFKWLYVSDIIHKTNVDIRMPGRASSQTIINSITKQTSAFNSVNDTTTTTTSGNSSSTPSELVIDKPFLFFIMDSVSGLIISMGKVGKESVHYRLPI